MAGDLLLKIKATFTDGFTKPLVSLTTRAREFGQAFKTNFTAANQRVDAMRGAVTRLAAAFAAYKVAAFVRDTISATAAASDLAQGVGDGIENISELQEAFDRAGVKGEAFSNILRQLLRVQQQALNPASKQAEFFREIGISVSELETLQPSRLFERLASALGTLDSQQARSLALAKLLPETFVKALPVVGRGLASFQSQIESVRRDGATITQEQADAAKAFEVSLGRLRSSVEGVARQMLVAFGPRLTLLFDRISEAISKNRDLIVSVGAAIGKSIVAAVDVAVQAIIGLVGVIESIPGVKLVDTSSMDREIADLKHQLAVIDEAVAGSARKRLAEIERVQGREFPTLSDPAGIAQRVDLSRAIREAEEQRTKILEELLPKRPEIEKRLAELQAQLGEGLSGAIKRTRDKLASDVQSLGSALSGPSTPGAAPPGLPTIPEFRNYVERLQDEAGDSAAAISSVFRDASGGIAKTVEAMRDLATTESDEISAMRERLQLQLQLAKLAPEEANAMKVAAIGLQEELEKLALQEAFRKQRIDAGELAKAIAYVVEQFARLRTEAQGGFSVGLSKSLEGLRSQAQNLGTTIGSMFGDVLTHGVDQFADALASIAARTENAREAFKRFAISFLADILKMIAKATILSGIKLGFALESGGVVPGEIKSTAPLKKFATGGVARSPTLALFGEGRSAEAYVPLPDGRSIPVTMRGGGGGGTVVLNITAMDSKDVTRTLIGHQGLLRTIWQIQAETRGGVRDTIRRAAV